MFKYLLNNIKICVAGVATCTLCVLLLSYFFYVISSTFVILYLCFQSYFFIGVCWTACIFCFCNVHVFYVNFILNFSDMRYFSCPDCHESLPSIDVLVNHLHIHNDEKDFDCLRCLTSFKSSNLLRSHLCSGNINCQFCDVVSKNNTEFKKHMSVAHTELLITGKMIALFRKKIDIICLLVSQIIWLI